MKKIIIGSRESALAAAQTKILQEYIRENCPGISAEILFMKTTGDKILEKRLDEIGGKGLFVKELDRALLEGRTQLSVHSLKDLPMEVSGELPLIGFSRREDPRDVLVLPENMTEMNPALPIGTSSLRRELQINKLYPGIKVEMIRGNLVSRLQKLEEGKYSALVLAAAGLKRLGLEHRISRYFSCKEMLPAAGQGILVVQGRKNADYSFLSGFFDDEARDAALAERAFVRCLNGGCSSPVAAYAVCEGEKLVLTGLFADMDNEIKRAGTAFADKSAGDYYAKAIQEKQLCGSHAAGGDYYIRTIRGKRADAEELGRRLAEIREGKDENDR